MADEGDIAKDYADRLNMDSIARVLAGAHAGTVSEHRCCEWCGAEIHEQRRAACPGCNLCVQCQAIKERLPGRA